VLAYIFLVFNVNTLGFTCLDSSACASKGDLFYQVNLRMFTTCGTGDSWCMTCNIQICLEWTGDGRFTFN